MHIFIERSEEYPEVVDLKEWEREREDFHEKTGNF